MQQAVVDVNHANFCSYFVVVLISPIASHYCGGSQKVRDTLCDELSVRRVWGCENSDVYLVVKAASAAYYHGNHDHGYQPSRKKARWLLVRSWWHGSLSM